MREGLFIRGYTQVRWRFNFNLKFVATQRGSGYFR